MFSDNLNIKFFFVFFFKTRNFLFLPRLYKDMFEYGEWNFDHVLYDLNNMDNVTSLFNRAKNCMT